MKVYDKVILALRGAGCAADELCREDKVRVYAIVRLAKKEPMLMCDDSVYGWVYAMEVKLYARIGLSEWADRAEEGLLNAGFTPIGRSDGFDGEYQIATMMWRITEEQAI